MMARWDRMCWSIPLRGSGRIHGVRVNLRVSVRAPVQRRRECGGVDVTTLEVRGRLGVRCGVRQSGGRKSNDLRRGGRLNLTRGVFFFQSDVVRGVHARGRLSHCQQINNY